MYVLLLLLSSDRVQHAEHLQLAAEPERGRAGAIHAGQDERYAPGHLRLRADPIGRCLARPRQQQGVRAFLSALFVLILVFFSSPPPPHSTVALPMLLGSGPTISFVDGKTQLAYVCFRKCFMVASYVSENPRCERDF